MEEERDGKVLELFARRPLHEGPLRSAIPARGQHGESAPEPRPPQHEPLWRELVGQVLRSERIEARRTLQQVAGRAGVSPQYLSEVERGRKDPSSEMLESICGALGLRLSDLLAVSRRTLANTATASSTPVTRPSGITSLAA